MDQVCKRLEVAHGTPISLGMGLRKVYFILAVGLKWMPFVWDPFNQSQPLRIRDHAKQDQWTVHRFVAPVQLQQQNMTAILPGGVTSTISVEQDHIQTDSSGKLYIDTLRADSLDWWTGNQGVPNHLRSLFLLESLFAMIKTETYPDWNPIHWSG